LSYVYAHGLDVVCMQSKNLTSETKSASKRNRKTEKTFDSIEAYADAIDLISEVT
jgi:hypothetical protein